MKGFALALGAGALLLGCAATPKPSTPPSVPSSPSFAKAVSALPLAELGGRTVLIFPDVSPANAFERAAAFTRECLPGLDRVDEPHGFRLEDAGALQLRVTLGKVSKSSALALDGPMGQEPLKSALGEAISGELSC